MFFFELAIARHFVQRPESLPDATISVDGHQHGLFSRIVQRERIGANVPNGNGGTVGNAFFLGQCDDLFEISLRGGFHGFTLVNLVENGKGKVKLFCSPFRCIFHSLNFHFGHCADVVAEGVIRQITI